MAVVDLTPLHVGNHWDGGGPSEWQDPEHAIVDDGDATWAVGRHGQQQTYAFGFASPVAEVARSLNSATSQYRARTSPEGEASIRPRHLFVSPDESASVSAFQVSTLREEWTDRIQVLGSYAFSDFLNALLADNQMALELFSVVFEARASSSGSVDVSFLRFRLNYEPGLTIIDLGAQMAVASDLETQAHRVASVSATLAGASSMDIDPLRIAVLRAALAGDATILAKLARVLGVSAEMLAGSALDASGERLVLVSSTMPAHSTMAVDMQRLRALAGQLAAQGLLDAEVIRALPPLRNPRVVILPAGTQLSLSPAGTRLRRH